MSGPAFCPRCGQRDVIFVNTDRDDPTTDTTTCRRCAVCLADGPSRPHLRQSLRETHSSRLPTDGGVSPSLRRLSLRRIP
jgi:hypothetical protein